MNVPTPLQRATSGITRALALAAGTAAYGNIVQVATPVDITGVAPGSNSGSVVWDVNGDGANDFQFSFNFPNTTAGAGIVWQAQMNPFTGTAATNGVLGYVGASFRRYAEAFTIGTNFGPTPPSNSPPVTFSTVNTVVLGSRYRSNGAFNYYGGFATNPTNPGTQAYVGFRFSAAGQTLYGWLKLSIGAGTIDFVGAAYQNTPGTAIAAGAIPEPGTLGFLAMGAVGALGTVIHRRRARR